MTKLYIGLHVQQLVWCSFPVEINLNFLSGFSKKITNYKIP
jgi:hypothetical protein